jgi:hypothetical protein
MPSKIIKTAQIYPIPTDRIIGRTTAGSGAAEELTAAQARAVLGVDTQITLNGVANTFQLDVTPFGSQTANQVVFRNTSAAVVTSIDAEGRIVMGSGSWALTSSFNATMWAGGAYGWTSAGAANGTSTLETGMYRDGAAGVIASRVGTQPHTHRIYNTYTNASNYERANVGFISNVFVIGSYNSGTGTLRDIHVGVSGNKIGFFGTTAIAQPTTGSAAATFVANSGVAVTDASTFDGYTLGQVVKALRNYGLLT